MEILKMLKKKRILFESEEQRVIADKILLKDEERIRVYKKRKKILKSLKNNKDLYLKVEKEINKLIKELNFKINNLHPLISIGYDKRKLIYNFIYQRFDYKFCVYIGNENTIRQKLRQFYKNDINEIQFIHVKQKLIEIIRIGLEGIKKIESFRKKEKITFDLIVDKYVESGRWETWRKI